MQSARQADSTVSRARTRAASVPRSRSTSIVCASVTVTGDVSLNEDLVLSGVIEGSVKSRNNHVTVEESGFVRGRILARQAHIRGTVVGDIEALEKVGVGPGGKVEGTIVAPRVAIEDGASFNGRIEMDFGGDCASRSSH